MKVISYTALHYGADYLGYAIRSVIDHVDEHVILYSDRGSHGHRTERECPDKKMDLYRIAQAAAGDKLRWIDGAWDYEGQQRDSIFQAAPDADVILVVDADEIWPDELVNRTINQTLHEETTFTRVPIIHFWRSFHRAVLHDPAFPARAIDAARFRNGIRTERTLSAPSHLKIAHMGYAQRPAIVEYKQHTHGHRGEWRQDDWFNTVFMANAQTNTHPVGSDYWNPETVDPADYLPEFMREHPYWSLPVIGEVREVQS